MTFPKQGTTWTISIIERLRQLEYTNSFSDQDIIRLGMDLFGASPWLESQLEMPDFIQRFEYLENLPKDKVRVFKSHSPITLLSRPTPPYFYSQNSAQPNLKKLKHITCIRNPLDQMVSHYHHFNAKFAFKGTFEEYFHEYALPGVGENGCWFGYHENLFQAYADDASSENSELDDKIILFYEEMKADNGEAAIKKLAKYLKFETNLTAENLLKIQELTSFKTMQKVANQTGFGPMRLMEGRVDVTKEKFAKWQIIKEGDKKNYTSAHVRRGQVNDWKNYVDDKLYKIWCDHVDEKVKSCPRIVENVGIDYLKGGDLKKGNLC